MAVFVSFTAARDEDPCPLEWFPSIQVAMRHLVERGRTGRSRRALVSDTETYSSRDWFRVVREVDFPGVDAGGWMARVWWRRAGSPAPELTDRAGELWVPTGLGVERTRVGEWDTGKAWKEM